MNPSLFTILNNNPAVKALLGTSPLRVYPFGQVDQNTPKPYAAYSVYNGNPENYLGEVPDIDNMGTQVDVYAQTGVSASACAKAIRDAIEPFAHMTSFSTPARDAQTQLYSCRLEFDFWENR